MPKKESYKVPVYHPYLTREQSAKQIQLAKGATDPYVIFERWKKAGLTRGIKKMENAHYVARALRAATKRTAKVEKKNAQKQSKKPRA